eukprot:TRINITY_DN120099_c0_g1_i1.p1 TRINITY_DN120099_c0_g1~~TRINITY_DN120099_c0_g1_i1.p1  ORF type:complete len:911 (-),score=199.95 TRINITY_DN120099_c0_g1_i1:2871-5603(-)
MEEINRKIALAEQHAKTSEEIAAARIAEKEVEVKRVKAECMNEKKMLLGEYQNLVKEKARIESELEEKSKWYKEKMELNQEEIADLSKCVKVLLDRGEYQKVVLRNRCIEIGKMFMEMHREFERREGEISKQAEILSKKRNEIENMLEDLSRKFENSLVGKDLATFRTLYERDIDILKGQLAVKDKEISALRETKLTKVNSSRKNITDVVGEMLKFVDDSYKNEEDFLNTISEVKVALEKLVEVQENEAASQMLEKILEENNKLKSGLAKASRSNAETLRAELVQTQLELEKAKKVIYSNNSLIQNLEEKLSTSYKKESPSELHRAKIEILRLNSENEALIAENNKLNEYYTNAIAQLEQSLAQRSEQYQEISSKHVPSCQPQIVEYNSYLSGSAKGLNTQVLEALDIINQTLAQLMGKKIQALTAENKKLLSLQKAALQTEELKMLREEVGKVDQAWEMQKQSWDKERVELENEIHVLREKDKATQRVYDDLLGLLNEKAGLLQDEINQTKSLKESLQAKDEINEKAMNSVNNWMEALKRTGESEGIKEMLLQLFDQLSEKIELQENMHRQELESLNSAYQEKIMLIKEREESAMTYAESLKGELELSKQQISKSGELFDKAVMKARVAIEHAAKETAGKDVKNLVLEVGKLKEELLMVKKKASERETKMVAEFADNMKALYKLLEDKNEIIGHLKKLNTEIMNAQTQSKDSSGLKEFLVGLKEFKEIEQKVKAAFAEHKKALDGIKGTLKETVEDINLFTEATKAESEGKPFLLLCNEKQHQIIGEVKGLMLKIEEMEKRHDAETELLKAEKSQLEFALNELKGNNVITGSATKMEQLQTDRIIKLEKENEEMKKLYAELKDKYIKETASKFDKLNNIISKLRSGKVEAVEGYFPEKKGVNESLLKNK